MHPTAGGDHPSWAPRGSNHVACALRGRRTVTGDPLGVGEDGGDIFSLVVRR
jgi:hypothetical protein